MADGAENHTIKLLQETRVDFTQRMDDMNQRFTHLTQPIDGNTLTFDLVAGVVYNHEERVDRLEQGRA